MTTDTTGSFYFGGGTYGTVNDGLGNVPAPPATPKLAESSFYLNGTVYTEASPTIAAASASAAAASAAAAAASASAATASSASAASSAASFASYALKTYVDAADALKAATTYVDAADALKANTASPTFTGIVTAPATVVNSTAADSQLSVGSVAPRIGLMNSASWTSRTAGTRLVMATSPTHFGLPNANDAALFTEGAPSGGGNLYLSANAGSAINVSQLVLKTDGTVLAPTPTAGNNSTQIATTAFVATSFAPLASPALTGTPTAPTATAGTNTTQVATTAFVVATVHDFDTVAQATAATVPSSVNFIRTAGYTVAGDGGGSLYKKGTVTGSGNFTTANAQAFTIVPQGGRLNVLQFGASTSGADSTTAFNACAAACVALKVPMNIPATGTGLTYLISATIDITGVPGVFGDGNESVVYTTTNIPMFQWNLNTLACTFLDFHDLILEGNVSVTRTSNAGFRFFGSTAGNYVSYCRFYNLTGLGVNALIEFDRTGLTGTSGEAQINWNSFSCLKSANYAANATNYGVRFLTGSGTGNTFASSNLVAATAGLYFNSGGSLNVGDISISNIQFGGGVSGGYGIVCSATVGLYGSNVSVNNCQFDAGSLSLQYTNMSNFRAVGCSWGGGSSKSLTNCSDYYIEGLGGSDPQINAVGSSSASYSVRSSSFVGGTANSNMLEELMLSSRSNAAATAAVELWRVTLGNVYTCATVEVTTFGLQQGLGQGYAVSKWLLQRSGTTAITATPLSDVHASIIHSVDVSVANTAKFIATCSGGAGGNALDTHVRVIGEHTLLQRM